MKKVHVILLLIVSVVNFAFVPKKGDAKQKDIDVFNAVFKNVENVKWFSWTGGHTVSFEKNGVSSQIGYDNNGNLVWSKRYFGEDLLPLNILLKIKAKYAGKDIVLVTEVVQDNELLYGVRLEDEKDTVVLEANGAGHIHVVQKFTKQRQAASKT